LNRSLPASGKAYLKGSTLG
jgi:hypothetical protein